MVKSLHRNTIHSTVLDTFGKKTFKAFDWLDTKATVMITVIKIKRSAHFQYINLQNSNATST